MASAGYSRGLEDSYRLDLLLVKNHTAVATPGRLGVATAGGVCNARPRLKSRQGFASEPHGSGAVPIFWRKPVAATTLVKTLPSSGIQALCAWNQALERCVSHQHLPQGEQGQRGGRTPVGTGAPHVPRGRKGQARDPGQHVLPARARHPGTEGLPVRRDHRGGRRPDVDPAQSAPRTPRRDHHHGPVPALRNVTRPGLPEPQPGHGPDRRMDLHDDLQARHPEVGDRHHPGHRPRSGELR